MIQALFSSQCRSRWGCCLPHRLLESLCGNSHPRNRPQEPLVPGPGPLWGRPSGDNRSQAALCPSGCADFPLSSFERCFAAGFRRDERVRRVFKADGLAVCGPRPRVESSPDTSCCRDPRGRGAPCQHLGVGWCLMLTPRDMTARDTHSTSETHTHTQHTHPQPHLEMGLHAETHTQPHPETGLHT